MIVALARKLLIALWRLVREGVVPDGRGRSSSVRPQPNLAKTESATAASRRRQRVALRRVGDVAT